MEWLEFRGKLSNDEWGKFKINFEEDNKGECIKKYIKRRSGSNVIGSAFVWHLTSEGDNYWCEIDDRFN